MGRSNARGDRPRRQRRRFGFGLFATQVAVILAIAAIVAGFTVAAQIEQVRREAEQDVKVLADSVAALPDVIAAIESDDPTAALSPIATALQEAAGVEYIAIVNMDGDRVFHTNPELIGKAVSSDHSAIREGKEFVGSENGPTGLTLRAKVPVFSDGAVIGTVSAGVLQSDVDHAILGRVAQVTIPTVIAVIVGVGVAWFVTSGLRRRLYGIGPDDILALVQTRQAATDGVRDGIIGIGENDSIVLMTPTARRLLGLTTDPMGSPAKDVLPPELRAFLDADADQSTCQLQTNGRRLVVTRADAQADGRAAGTTLVLQDHSELIAAVSAWEKERTLTDALRVETHDFDNRLHVIGGLIGRGDLEDARTYLSSLSRPERERVTEAWPTVRNPIVAALLASRSAQAEALGVTVSLAEDSRVEANFTCGPEEITVIGNLISNAVEAAAHRVDVFMRGDLDGLELSVEDDGPGIPQEDRANVFTRGHTSKVDDALRHGIGLDVVRGHVIDRHGTIEIDDADAGGARFTVELPAETTMTEAERQR